jgi:hypothetical protein
MITVLERARPLDRQMELAHLHLADRHIAEGELRVAAQVVLIEKIRGGNYPLGPAEDFLGLLRTTLAGWQDHRNLIIAALNE